MSIEAKDVLRAIKDQILITAGRFSDDKITVAQFRKEVDLLGRAYEVLDGVMAKPNG